MRQKYLMCLAASVIINCHPLAPLCPSFTPNAVPDKRSSFNAGISMELGVKTVFSPSCSDMCPWVAQVWAGWYSWYMGSGGWREVALWGIRCRKLVGKAGALICLWCPPLPPQHRQLSHSRSCPCKWFWEADATLCLTLHFLYTRNVEQLELREL